jgi:large repetitive protein
VPTIFVNVDNTIAGAGRIGDRGLTLKNGGTIDAIGATGGIEGAPLVIDTGSRVVTNTGTMEATGGTLYVASPLNNTGVLIASVYSIVAAQGATGGTAKLTFGSEIEFGGPTTTAVSFNDNSASSLILDDSVHFKGLITGFGKLNTDQSIDLLDIDPLTATKTFAPGSPNMLTVKDTAGHTAQLKFGGSYMAANFKLNNDGHGGTLIKDPPAASPANVALFGNYIAAGFPEPAAVPCPALLAGHEALAQPLAIPGHGG